ncbi:MAG: protein kinase [Rhodospirillales bacterium]|nr:MAG: protein kinase [Rhodospirillales bacterium]
MAGGDSTWTASGPRRSEDGGSFIALRPGTRVGKYETLEVLGQGAFGLTYRARDTLLGRDVAIKEYLPTGFAFRHGDGTVRPHSTATAEEFRWGRDRFLDEARTLARLEDAPGIVNVHDFMEANSTAYMVMSLVRGETLETRLKRDGPLPRPMIEQLVRPLLDGLERVHAAGFLHRDIKPANILIDAEGHPTLIDFGASRAALHGRTQALTAIYTPGYAAFEQFTSAPQGPWTDLYALGATLYHCVTGSMPPSAIDRVRDDAMVPATEAGRGRYDAGLLAMIDAAMRVREAERPQNIGEARRILSGGGPSGVLAMPGSATVAMAPAPAPTAPRRRAPVGWIAAGVVLALALAGGGAWLALRPPAESPEAALRRAKDEVRRQTAALTREREEAAARQAAEDEKRRVADEAARKAAEARAAADDGGRRQAEDEARARAAAEATRRREEEVRATAEEAERRERLARERALAEAEATRRRDEEARTAGEVAERRERLAREKALAEAEAARAAEAKAGSAADAKRQAEAGEATLRLSEADRKRIQVALTSVGHDTQGSDGAFGPRSRAMIAAWQRGRGEAETGFLTAPQVAALRQQAASALARYDEEQRRAEDEARRAAERAPSGAAVPKAGAAPQGKAAAVAPPAASAGQATYAGEFTNNSGVFRITIRQDGGRLTFELYTKIGAEETRSTCQPTELGSDGRFFTVCRGMGVSPRTLDGTLQSARLKSERLASGGTFTLVRQ